MIGTDSKVLKEQKNREKYCHNESPKKSEKFWTGRPIAIGSYVSRTTAGQPGCTR